MKAKRQIILIFFSAVCAAVLVLLLTAEYRRAAVEWQNLIMPKICENYLLDLFMDIPEPTFWDKNTKAVNDYSSEMSFIQNLSVWEQHTGISISVFGPARRVLFGRMPDDVFFDALMRSDISRDENRTHYGMRSWWMSDSTGLRWASYRPKHKGFVMFTFDQKKIDYIVRPGAAAVFYPVLFTVLGIFVVFVFLLLIWFNIENKKKKQYAVLEKEKQLLVSGRQLFSSKYEERSAKILERLQRENIPAPVFSSVAAFLKNKDSISTAFDFLLENKYLNQTGGLVIGSISQYFCRIDSPRSQIHIDKLTEQIASSFLSDIHRKKQQLKFLFNKEAAVVYGYENSARLLLEYIFFILFDYLPEKETVFVCSYPDCENMRVSIEFVFNTGTFKSESLEIAECIAHRTDVKYTFLVEKDGRSIIRLMFPTA